MAFQHSKLGYVRFSENALVPTKDSPQSAGFDLRNVFDVTIPKFRKNLVKNY